MTRRVEHLEVQAGNAQLGTVLDLDDVARLRPPGLGAELLLEHGHETGVAVAQRVDEPVPVVGVDVGRGVGATDRRHGPDVVDVPVRQQHGCRPEAVGRQDLPKGPLHADPWIDDDALLACGRCEHITVGVEREGGERDGQHAGSLTALRKPAQRHTAMVICCEKVGVVTHS